MTKTDWMILITLIAILWMVFSISNHNQIDSKRDSELRMCLERPHVVCMKETPEGPLQVDCHPNMRIWIR